MNWDQINYEHCEWRIPETKNGLPQVIPLSDEVITVLKSRQTYAINNYVFPGTGQCGHLVEPKKGWLRILNKQELRICVYMICAGR